MQSDSESNPPGIRGHSHSDIVNIVLIYAVIGALWIFLSDKIVVWFFKEEPLLTLFSMIKNWLYIALTSVLLYSLMQRWLGKDSSTQIRAKRSRRVVLTFISLATIILSLTCVAIFYIHMHNREVAVTRLQTVADMKVDQISDWLRDRQADAVFVWSSRYLVELYQLWQGSGDEESGDQLKARLEQFCKDWRFTGITVLDPAGQTLWRSENAPRTDVPDLKFVVQQAMADHKTWRAAAYRDAANKAHLDFVSPLVFIVKNPPLIILHIDLANWLFPALRLWPASNASGETLLFRFDKDQIIYLNELKQGEILPSKFKLPELVKNLATASSKAGKGFPDTLIESWDYRDIPVIAVIKAIPGTDWYLAAKVNRSELYADTVKDAVWIGSVGLLLLFITATGFHLVRQQQQLALAIAVQQSQTERINALNLLATISDTSSDAIFAKDLEGRYMLFNQAACNIVGKTVDEVIGRDDTSIFPAEQAEKLMAIGRRVITENNLHESEEALSTAKGERIFLATKGPLRNSAGTITGIFGISRDITDMKQIEIQLRQSEERLRFALDAGKDGLFDFNIASGLAFLSPRYYEMLGYDPDEVVPDFDFFKQHIHPDDLTNVMEIVEAHMQGKTPKTDFEYRLINAYDQITWVRHRAGVAEYDENGLPKRIVGTQSDITASKVTEESLVIQANELAERNKELERFNRATVGRELDMIALKKQVNDLSLKLGLQPPYDLSFLEASSLPPKPSGDLA